MLLELHVAGLGVIDDSRIEFGPGLSALTGETGAGKTLLVDALDLVLGGRPRRGLVQSGRSALIEARFLDEVTGEEVILAREIPSEGRARAWIDGRMASVNALSERAAGLCDIHGQHEHQSLLSAGAFRRALDSYGQIDTTALDEARAAVRLLETERHSLGGTPEEIERERALLEYQIAEIDAAGIEGFDERERLLEEIKMLEGAGSLRNVLEHALETLDVTDESNPRDVLAETRLALEGFESFDELRGALSTAESLLDDLGSELRKASELVEENPERLTFANERLSLLHHLCRRYGPTLDDVSLKRKEFGSQLATLLNAEDARLSLDERSRAANLVLENVAQEVLSKRQHAAPAMVRDLLARLSSLALEHASLEITLEGESGDRVDLLFSANPGLALAPVSAVASGGELARLMLAIRLALPGETPTMIFDEVDAGIGGSTAVALASALKDVSSYAQVLVVTHLAQVAAMASRQVSVSKDVGDSATLATAKVITGDERVREIARMLSGQPENETALEHARELLHAGGSAT